jgi:hypothetical protein
VLIAPCYQSKQLQIDDLLHKLDEKEHELSRVVEEKEQELAIMQEGMDTTLQQMSELQQVSIVQSGFRNFTLIIVQRK